MVHLVGGGGEEGEGGAALTGGTAHLLQANSVVMEEVVAPGWLHRFIIGRKGQNVQKITQDLPRVHVEFNSDLNKIILEGPPGEVTQAKEAFVTFTEDLVCDVVGVVYC